MKKLMSFALLIAVALVIMLNGGVALAQPSEATKDAGEHKPLMDNGGGSVGPVPALVRVDNTLCPVEGNKIGSKGEPITVAHKGKAYKLCSAACRDAFWADPDAFSKKADEEAASAAAAAAAAASKAK